MAGGGMRAGAGPANGSGLAGNQGGLLARGAMGGGAGMPLEFGAPVPGGGYLVHPRPGDARWSHGGLGGDPHAHGAGNSYGTGGGGSFMSFGGSGMDPRGDGRGDGFGGLGGVGGPAGDYVAARGRKHPTSNPDFVVVYTFLAGLFDPNQRAHGEKLRAMAPIDRETALLLMRNLGANLMCQRMWEDQIQLIGQGYPTFVNATYDERGGLTGVAGGHAMQASAAVGDGDGDGTSGDGSGDGAEGARGRAREGSAGSGGSDQEGGVGGAAEGDARGNGEAAAAATAAGGPEAGSRGGSPGESLDEGGTKEDGGDAEPRAADGGGDGGDAAAGAGGGGGGGGGAEPNAAPAAPPGDAAPLSAFLA